MDIGSSAFVLEKGWKILFPFSSNADMEQEYKTPQDLIPVIENAPGARRDFIEGFKGMVWLAAHKVGVKRSDQTLDDVYMQLWEAVFDHDCRMLRKFSGKSRFPSYLCACLVNEATTIARMITRENSWITAAIDDGGEYPQPVDVDSLSENFIRQEFRCEEIDNVLSRKQTFAFIREAVKRLPREKLRFFKRAIIEERTVEELMQEFGIPSGNAVYQWRCRILGRLRELIGKDLAETY